MNNNFNFDPDMLMNAMMMNEKSLAPMLQVLNKYGIYGSKAITFLLEFGTAAMQMGGDQE